MGTKPRRGEYVSRLVFEKERAIYWVCALLERDGAVTREAARAALADLGYDKRRIASMLHLGEPGRRGAGESQRNRPSCPAGTAEGLRDVP